MAVLRQAGGALLGLTLRAGVLVYRAAISPLIGPRCRFLPTCSDYALQALSEHRTGHAVLLIAKRLARCHPLGASGLDEVPSTKTCGCARHANVPLLFPKDSTGS